jgi:NAD-dependent DNA ligase
MYASRFIIGLYIPSVTDNNFKTDIKNIGGRKMSAYYASFIIELSGKQKDMQKVFPIIKEKLPYDEIEEDEEIVVSRTSELIYCEDIAKQLALPMMKAAPTLKFSINGVTDTSESAGEYQDFRIEYANSKLNVFYSSWYISMFAANYFDDYEEFCEEYCDENEKPLYTEAQFEKFAEEEWNLVEDCNLPMLQVPLTYSYDPFTDERKMIVESKCCDGLTFVATGRMNTFKNRDAFAQYVAMLGGKVSNSVTPKTNYLVNNDADSSSSKNKKAYELNIPILTEEAFVEKFGSPVYATYDFSDADDWDW